MMILGPTNRDGDFRRILGDNGDDIGFFSLSDVHNGGRYFTQVVLHDDRRGQGLGKEVYRAVARELADDGEALVSDPESFGVNALHVWQSMVRGGEAEVTTLSDCPVVDDFGDVTGVGYEMVVRAPELALAGAE